MELMILNAYASIHIKSMISSLENAQDKNVPIAMVLQVLGHALADLNLLIM